MATSGKGTGTVGYNVQSAVDAQRHLVVDHQVTNIGNDRGRLATMAKRARTSVQAEHFEVVANRGYFSGGEILACVIDVLMSSIFDCTDVFLGVGAASPQGTEFELLLLGL